MKISVFTSIRVMGALGLLAAMPVHALGLGKIETSSALNEPFRAEIPVNAVRGDEAETLQVRLASNDEFERAGLVKSAAITQLRFKVIQKAGKTVVTVTSKNAVKEPLLDFLLMAKTSDGQLIREYTVLLDPPKSMFKQPVRTAKIIPSPNRSQPKRIVTQSVQASEPRPSLAGVSQYGPTSNTDTLWSIASKTRPSEDVTVQQMMMALVEKNANAFVNKNVNGLKRGYTLAIPSLSEIKQLTSQQAKVVVTRQNTVWHNRDVAVKAVTRTATAQGVDEVAQDPSAEQALPSVDIASAKGEPTARLQLSGSNNDKLLSGNDLAAFGNDQVKELSEQLTIAQEVIESQQQENIDIKARMVVMDEQIQTLRKLIALQDPDLARLQSKLEQESAEQAAGTLEEMTAILNDSESDNTESLIEQTGDTLVDASLEMGVEPAVEESEESAAEPLQKIEVLASTEQDVGDLALTESSNEATQDAMNEAPQATLLDKVQAFLVEHKMTVLLAGLAFLLGLIVLIRKKAGSGGEAWHEVVEKANSQVSEPVIPERTPSLTPAVKDMAPEPEHEPVKTINDLINDADIYVTYDDFDKAEQVLLGAYNEEPTNQVVIHKLLFTYYKQAKVTAFGELARQYSVDRESVEWGEVAEWGRELDSENVLFAAPAVNDAEPVDVAELEDGLAFDISSENEESATLGLEQVEQEDAESVDDGEGLAFTTDFDLDETEISAVMDESGLDDLSDMDLSLFEDDKDFEIEDLEPGSEIDLEAATLAVPETELEAAPLAISDTELDPTTLALSESSNDDGLAFDLGDFDEIDEADTKLDLASAYIEMGDPEGAKTILQEIVSEGNDEQKSRAETLMNDL